MISIETSAEAAVAVGGVAPTDITAFVIAFGLLCNAWVRVRRGSPNVTLLWANLAMVVTMICSVSFIYAWVDPLLGGQSYLNLGTHLLMVFVGWSISRSTHDTLARLEPTEHRPLTLRGWVPAMAVIGVIISFLVLDPRSSRGLEGYDDRPAYIAYWAFSVLALLVPAVSICPRIVRIFRIPVEIPRIIRLSLGFLLFSYIGAGVVLTFYALTAVFQDLYLLREIFVAVTLAAFTLAFTLASAALPPERGKRNRLHRPAPTPRTRPSSGVDLSRPSTSRH